MDIEKEPIIIDVPLLEEKSEERKERKSPKKLIPTVAAALLIAFSLLIHSAIAARACEYLKENGSELLLSFLIPDYKKSEPMIPPLPEQSEIRGEEEEQFDFLIRESDLSTRAEYGLALTNETAYTPDLYQLLGSDRPAPTLPELDRKYGKDAPKVLIYHSHATEGYADSFGTGFRTKNTDKNVVAIGAIIARVLERAGIATVHVTELFDGESWSQAYDNSNSAVRTILAKYPSISYVFDIHRDCIGNESEGYVKATASAFDKDVAQLMFVCGTDEGGSSHTEWRKNLTTALQLQSGIFSDREGLMRPVNLRRASFYQDTSPASLILECGTCANTLREAERSAVIFAKELADYIKGEDCKLDTEHLIATLCP